MSWRNFLDEKKKEFPAFGYLFVSSDPFLHSEAISIIKGFVPESERDFNFQVFDLLSSEPGNQFERILDVANTVPFFSGRKFVIVENFQKIVKKDLKRLEAYLQKPSESSVVVFLNAGTVKKEVKEGLKGLKQIVLDIREGDIPAWLKEKAQTKGFELTVRAIDYLLGTIGADLGLLASEIEKFTLIGKPKVDRDDIAELVRGSRTYSAFALVDAIRARDSEKALKIYNVLKETEEPHGLIGALNWQYGRMMATAVSAKDREYMFTIFDILNKADIAIKTSGGTYPVELMLLKLINIPKQK